MSVRVILLFGVIRHLTWDRMLMLEIVRKLLSKEPEHSWVSVCAHTSEKSSPSL